MPSSDSYALSFERKCDPKQPAIGLASMVMSVNRGISPTVLVFPSEQIGSNLFVLSR